MTATGHHGTEFQPEISLTCFRRKGDMPKLSVGSDSAANNTHVSSPMIQKLIISA